MHALALLNRSVADWDLRSGRNSVRSLVSKRHSVADWDLRSGRNYLIEVLGAEQSVADWDLRSGLIPWGPEWCLLYKT